VGGFLPQNIWIDERFCLGRKVLLEELVMAVLKPKILLICVFGVLISAAGIAEADWFPGDGFKMHYPQLPDPFGWDICVFDQWVADDFQCSQDGPINDIHFWISWLDDWEDPANILSWDISIWSDAIGGPGACLMQPGTRLWTWQGDGNVQINWWPVDGDQGWHCPSAFWSVPNNHVNIYQINITNIQDVLTQVAGDIYWLVIKVNLMTEPPPVPGWKTSTDAWRCRALWSPTGGPPWRLVDTGTPMGLEPVYHDMAFVITSDEQDEGPKHKNLKWSQPPIEIDPTSEIPTYSGWNEVSYIGGPGTSISTPVYENWDANSLGWYLPVGPNMVGDDMSLAGIDRELDYYDFAVNAPPGTAPYTVTSELYTEVIDPCTGFPIPGVPIAGTFCNHNVPGGGHMWLTCSPGPGIFLPDNLWMVLWFSDDSAGWQIGEMAETGFTADLFALDEGAGWTTYWFGGYPWAGFEANIWCKSEHQGVTVVADDFRCLGNMPVESIHWWGSHYGWEDPEVWPPVLPIGWDIRFWSNVPADPTADPNYSYPHELLWQFQLDASRVTVEQVGMDYYHGYYPEDVCYQYYVDLEPNEVFWQGDFLDRTQDDVFWISIAAVYDPWQDPIYPWGWKTRPWSWMDDAVRIVDPGPRDSGEVLDPYWLDPYWIEPIKDPLYGESFDVAFELDTDPNFIKWEQPFTGIRDWPHYEDELSMAIEHGDLVKWQQMPDPYGWDICLCNQVADDFVCTQTGPITDIHFWISGQGDQVGEVNDWEVSIWNDRPDQAGAGPVWTWNGVGNVSTNWDGFGPQGYFCQCAGPPYWSFPPEHWNYYKVDIDNISEPFVQEAGTTYWLVIKADFITPCAGWKTSLDHYGSDGVYWDIDTLMWEELVDPITGASLDLAFEITTPRESVSKYIQQPDWSTTGIDVDATAIDPCQLLADDFPCDQTGPITDVHIWGSWLDDKLPADFGQQVAFKLSIHADIPANQSSTGYSMPGELKWSRWFGPGQWAVQMFSNGAEAYYSPCEGIYYPDNHYILCKYSFYINPADAFVQEAGNIYWLDVEAKPLAPDDPNIRFGWKTSIDHWNDDAVWRTDVMPVSRPWEELRYPPEHPYYPNSIDLAFELTTQVGPDLEIDRLVADDWPCDQNTPITAAVWWGSYIGYQFKPCHGPFMELPVPPDYFWLAIWDDVPAGDPWNLYPYSHPNDILWQYKAYEYDEVLVGYDKHPHGGLDVVICGAPSVRAWNNDVQAKLQGTGQFNSVTIIDANLVTPTLAQLQTYDAVLVYSDSNYQDAIALGNVLADYVDSGGGVVCAMFEIGYGSGPFPHPTAQLKGRWDTQGYYVLPRTQQHGPPQATLGTVYNPAHPIMQGVSTFDGGTFSARPSPLTPIPPGVTLVADWNDTSPLVATKTIGGVPRADLGLYPPSADVRGDFWVSTTDGALLMANALTWVAGGHVPSSGPREPVFRYSVKLPHDDWFLQDTNDGVYWFSAVAVYNQHVPNYEWGWTNHQHVFNDDAVEGYYMMTEPWQWEWFELYDQTGETEDMSFILFTDPNGYTCWDPLECAGQPSGDGTCDGNVNLADLFALKMYFGTAAPWTDPQCCSDYNHDNAVNLGDLFVLKMFFGTGPYAPAALDQRCP
jgi:hypothetical protein